MNGQSLEEGGPEGGDMSSASMKRDVLAGMFVSAIGGGVVYASSSLEMGTLHRMDAGYFPIVLGMLLAGLGILIAVGGVLAGPLARETTESIQPPDLRGCAAIILSVVAFVGIGSRFGLVPATFISALIAAAGDRQTTFRGAMALAMVLVVVAVGLFSYVLKIPFPLVRW